LPRRSLLQGERCKVDGFVAWPPSTDPLCRLVGVFPFPTSDHRLVALDVALR